MRTYYEKNLIINNREVKYQGIFQEDELFSIINKALTEKGYEKREKKTEETVKPEGRSVRIELRPYKEKTNYVTLMIKIKINLKNVQETVKEIEGRRRKFSEGEVTLIFDAWTLTDYEHRWGTKPLVYFIKGMINKFIYKFPLEKKINGELRDDTAYLVAQVKELFRSYGSEEEKVVSEKEVREEMEREIGERN